MFWAKLLLRLSEDVNQHLLTQNEMLRAQVEELQAKQTGRIKFSVFFKRRLARLAGKLSPEALAEGCVIIKPSTVLRWHRELIARKFDGAKHRSYPGRPRVDSDVEALVVEMAECNQWGVKRIQGALLHLGHCVAHQTILNILKRNGLHPSPHRRHDDSWARFLKTHRAVTVATDFLTQEVLTLKGYVTYYILFFIRLDGRQLKVAGISRHPNEQWMLQMARNLTDREEPFLSDTSLLICDRDSKYTHQFRRLLKRQGIRTIRLPPHSPNLNAFAERWVRSIKEECLNHLILFGEGSLRRAVAEYVEFYNSERPHQGLNNRLVSHDDAKKSENTQIKVKSRLGGLLNFYYR